MYTYLQIDSFALTSRWRHFSWARALLPLYDAFPHALVVTPLLGAPLTPFVQPSHCRAVRCQCYALSAA